MITPRKIRQYARDPRYWVATACGEGLGRERVLDRHWLILIDEAVSRVPRIFRERTEYGAK